MVPVPPQRDCSFEGIHKLEIFPSVKIKFFNRFFTAVFAIVTRGAVSSSATFDALFPDSTSMIALNFSESDNLFVFKLVNFHNIQLQCNWNYNLIWNDEAFE